MKTFLAVFIGTPEARQRSGWDSLSAAQRQERELLRARAAAQAQAAQAS